MNSIVKTPAEIELMRISGKILAEILHGLVPYVHAGASTESIDRKAEAAMATHHVDPSFKGYKGFPCVTCISINEEIVHAIPGKRKIQNGDIVTIDCGVIYRGFHSDSAITIMVGAVKPEVRRFVETTQKALEKAEKILKPNIKTGDIGAAIQSVIESAGYTVVPDFIGHGIGRHLHEYPEVPNFGKKGTGVLLVPGMTIAIEPIAAMGKKYCLTLSDQWTAVTKDGLPACQIEHTFLITETGNEILTMYNNTIKNIYSQ